MTSWRGLSPAARLLIANQFGITLGFFMVLPFLAGYLRDDLGFAPALIGTVLGVRTLCQQGLYVVGGPAADRLSLRGMIMLGLGLRVVAFGLFATVTSAAGVIAATALTGVAGAVFNPAVQTYLTHESPGRRAETFTLLNVMGNAGTLLGPVVGALLLNVDFRLVSAAACAVFALLTVAQLFMLPGVERTAPEHGVWNAWVRVLANRKFLAFTLAGAAYFALFNQLYLAIPWEAERATGYPAAVSAVFIVSTAVGLTSGVRLTALCRRFWTAHTSMAVGLGLIAVGFLPMAASAALLPTAGGRHAALAGLPDMLGVLVFSAGISIAYPFMMELIPIVGSESMVGTYFGFFWLGSSLLAAGVSSVTGALLDQGWVPFAFLFAVGAAGGVGMARLNPPAARVASAVPIA